MEGCFLCPRKCGARRKNGELGACGMGSEMRIARIALHRFEEPPISGEVGSGTVFFCGCSLRCVFCQNKDISRGEIEGKVYSPSALADAIRALEASGAANINLVTPTHFADRIIEALEKVKPSLSIPVLYNTSGYESVQTLRRFQGLVDIYMPDFKYMSSDNATLYSSAPDYPDVAIAALREMYRQVGACRYGDDGMLLRGMLVRHLVLPGCRKDSIEVLRTLAEILPKEDILVSIMSQYTPDFAMDCSYKNLRRRLTRFEYESVTDYAAKLGINGFIQELSSAKKDFTPDFSESNNL